MPMLATSFFLTVHTSNFHTSLSAAGLNSGSCSWFWSAVTCRVMEMDHFLNSFRQAQSSETVKCDSF